MSDRHEAKGRTIHPRALEVLGEEACIVALGVARDLRSGVISPEEYDQGDYCGTSCCIAGHIARRLRVRVMDFIDRPKIARSKGLRFFRTSLFSGSLKSDPQRAADAIYRYVYDGSETPWVPTA